MPCSLNKKIRAMYQQRTEVRPRTAAERPLPAEPTSAWPGSEEKLRILVERANQKEQLFHPGDRRVG